MLVVGAGNSGCDIACDAAIHGDRAALWTRRGYRFVPKYVLGQPTDVFAHRGPPLPAAVEQKVLTRLIDLLVGDVTCFGLPAPDHDVLATHPIMNTAVLDHLGHGALVARRRGINPNLYLNVFHRDRDDLLVIGMIETDASAWPHISLQAKMIAAWLDLLGRDPAQAEAFRAQRRTHPDLEGGLDHVDSPRHSYYQRNHTYLALAWEVLRQLREGQVTPEPVDVGVAATAGRAARRLARTLPLGRGDRAMSGAAADVVALLLGGDVMLGRSSVRRSITRSVAALPVKPDPRLPSPWVDPEQGVPTDRGRAWSASPPSRRPRGATHKDDTCASTSSW